MQRDIRKEPETWKSSKIWRKGLMCGIDKACVVQNMLCFRKLGHSCDSYCIGQEEGSLQKGQLVENCFTDFCPFLGVKVDDPVVLRIAYASGWSSRRGFYTEEWWLCACVCSSWHPGASAAVAGNSSLTRIHSQHLVCKHSDGFIRLNLWRRRHLAFLICAWTSHLKMTDTVLLCLMITKCSPVVTLPSQS